MIDFRKLDGPHGIPVYYQRMPRGVKSVSLRWLMFTGSADDEAGGGQGIYHWFEHVPSRGTVKYPGGYAQVERLLSADGGDSDAHTAPTHTAFYAHVPRRRWKEALDILTDMIARPLLADDGIRSERKIILEELSEWRSSAPDFAQYALPGILWRGHPLGHHPLGSAGSIRRVNSAQLRTAFRKGYARSRAALIVAGRLDENELLDEIARYADRIPATRLRRRRTAQRYGALPPWKPGKVTVRKTRFDGSVVFALFPVERPGKGLAPLARWIVLNHLLEDGGLGSPIDRLLREKNSLTYSAGTDCAFYPDGGYWGFTAETGARNVEKVLAAFRKVLRHPELRSAEWHRYVRGVILEEPNMRGLNPHAYTDEAEDRLCLTGEVQRDGDYLQALGTATRSEMTDFLDFLTEIEPRVVVFQGTG